MKPIPSLQFAGGVAMSVVLILLVYFADRHRRNPTKPGSRIWHKAQGSNEAEANSSTHRERIERRMRMFAALNAERQRIMYDAQTSMVRMLRGGVKIAQMNIELAQTKQDKAVAKKKKAELEEELAIENRMAGQMANLLGRGE